MSGTVPVIPAITRASLVNSANLPFTINRTIFQAMAPPRYQTGPTTRTVTAASVTASLVKCSLPLTGIPGGFCNTTICNSDGVNTTGTDIFYVTDQAWINKAPETVGRSQVVKRPGVPVAGDVRSGITGYTIHRYQGEVE